MPNPISLPPSAVFAAVSSLAASQVTRLERAANPLRVAASPEARV